MSLKEQRPYAVIFLLIVLAFQGLSGLLGGLFLVFDPSGKSLQLPLEFLSGTPFSDYFYPGLILLVVLGIFPLIVVYGLWKNDHRAWFGSLTVGIALLIWIFVEILMIGYQVQPPLQLIYGITGLMITFLTLLTSVRRYYSGDQTKNSE